MMTMASAPHVAQPVVALKIADPLCAAKQIRDRHIYWCERVRKWLLSQNIQTCAMPACDLSWLGGRAAGKYFTSNHTCRYYLPYAMVLGIDSYDETIAHEVVHAYQRCLLPSPFKMKYHGESFFIMMKLACGYLKHSHFHQYPVKQVRAVAKALKPVQDLFEATGINVNTVS